MYRCIFAVGLALATLLLAALPRQAHGQVVVLQWESGWKKDNEPRPGLPETGFVVQSCETDWKTSPCVMRDEVGGFLPVNKLHHNVMLPTQGDVSKCYQVLAVLQGVRSVPTAPLCLSR